MYQKCSILRSKIPNFLGFLSFHSCRQRGHAVPTPHPLNARISL